MSSYEPLNKLLQLLPPEVTAHPQLALEAIRAELAVREQRLVEEQAQRIREECRSLAGFVRHGWRILEPRAKLIWGWHLDAMCEHLEACSNGQITRLLTNVPPGSSKSLIHSVLWPAWEWAMGRPDLRYLTCSFNDVPVKRDVRKCRDLILSPWFATLFPEMVGRNGTTLKRAGETSYENWFKGTRDGVAFGSLTSQRGDRLIIDDPHSTETAESETDRDKTTRKFREGALDRLNDLETSIIDVIMQRLHEQDVSGVILSEELRELGFVHLMIPMRFEIERKCIVRLGEAPKAGKTDKRPIFWQDPRKVDGELMEPKRFPAKAVNKQEVGKGDYAFAGQYQQRPAPREGGMFKVEKITTVPHSPVSKGAKTVRGWDIAGSIRKKSPYTAGGMLRLMPNGDLYIMDMRRDRLKIGAAEQLIVDTAFADTLSVRQSIPQDPGQAGLSQRNQLAGKLGGLDFRFSPESGAKEDRAIPFASQVEAGKVYMVKGDWNTALIEELRNFPSGSYKDQVDALSRAYSEILKMRDGRGGLAGAKVINGR
jgi:predicted phage terminase large subunit-like protein